VLDVGVVVGLCVEGSGGEDVVVRNGGDIVVLPKYTFDIIIELTSRTFSKGNGSFPFYVDSFFPLSPTRVLPDIAMCITMGVYKETRNTHPSGEYDFYLGLLLV
jgi:hypothetical protein